MFAIKVNRLKLETQNQAKHIPGALTNSSIKGVPELWSDKQKDKPTNRNYNFIYRDNFLLTTT